MTPGRCDLAPGDRPADAAAVQHLRSGRAGSSSTSPSAMPATSPVAGADAGRRLRSRSATAVEACTAGHALTLLLGGNNAVTRPAAHGARPAARRGRPDHPRRPFRHARHRSGPDERQSGPLPARGRPARRQHLPDRPRPLRQYRGRCTTTPAPPGSRSGTSPLVLEAGIEAAIDAALEQLSHVEAIIVDFDIDVIDRAQCPGAPGARPGGLPVADFFRAARRLAAEPSGSAWSTSPSSIPSLDVVRHHRADRRPLGLRNPRRLRDAGPHERNRPQLAEAFKQAMRRVAATVNVISICVDGKPMGITATAVSVVSMDPPSLLVCVNQRRLGASADRECRPFLRQRPPPRPGGGRHHLRRPQAGGAALHPRLGQ